MERERRSCRVGQRTVEAQAFLNGQSGSVRLERVGGGPANSLAEASKDLLEGEEVKEDEIKNMTELPGSIQFCPTPRLIRFQLPSSKTFTEIEELDPGDFYETLGKYVERGVKTTLNVNLPELFQLQKKKKSITTPNCGERKGKLNQRIDIPMSLGDRRSKIKRIKENPLPSK